MARVLIYGAYGYSGLLILEDSVKKGLRVVIGGRSETKCVQLAKKYSVPYVVFALNQSNSQIDEQLKKADVVGVMNCAGPFSETFGPMTAACLRNGLHYLDITGEIPVFEAAHALDKEAKEAKIMILPGTGNDIVPSDCLAARLKRRLPTATHLTLGMGEIKAAKSRGRPLSHGTMKTMVGFIGEPSLIRREGKIVPVRYLDKMITMPRLKEGESRKSWGVSIPWGDVSTAYHSTGIPNISFFFAVHPIVRWALWIFSFAFIRWILGSGPVQRLLKGIIPEGGPSEAHREETRFGLVGEVLDTKNGKLAVSFLRTNEGYKITQLASVAIMQRIAAGDAPIGFRTPSLAYGEDFITKIGGDSTFEDLEIEITQK